MLNWLQQLFKKKELKNFSLTTTDTSEGESTLQDIDTHLKDIYTRLKSQSSGTISLTDANYVIEHELNVKPLTSAIVKVNLDMFSLTLFELSSIDVELSTATDKVSDIKFIFTDMLNNTGIKLIVPAKSVEELLIDFKYIPPSPPSARKNVKV